ncbi:rho GTPase-activating protein 20 [Trichonephila clavata]|uniref:Rho GTPase-activating protein 20 n=1 Tax=Trichonephila clavata TaxID=2740835 RepID=A0A8X6HHL1_TRICU|nr:rho GTPase-activating protein 20 [Trichonephila clavata]
MFWCISCASILRYCSLKTKDLWQQKFLQLIEESKEKEGQSQTSIQISFRKPETGEETYKTIKVDNRLTVQDSIKRILQSLGYPLWVKTGKDEAPYPLIGHEYPFSIKMNFIRELLRRSDLDLRNLNNISTDTKCYFILRKNSFNNSTRVDPRVQKKRKKHRRPIQKINWLFRKPASKHDSVDSGNSSPPPHNLFGLPLWKLCPDNVIPKPVMSMLVQLFQQGPYTVGIFRKSANARACRELKRKTRS